MSRSALLLVSFLVLTACGGGGGGGDPAVVLVTTLADAGVGSLRQVVADAPSGAIVRFDAALSGDLPLASAIVLTRDVRIEGPGAGTISVTTSVPTLQFSVEEDVEARISGLSLVGAIGIAGGAIDNFGSLELDGVVIDGAVGSRGGGVWTGGPLEMRDCTVRGCSAFNGGGVSCDGGDARFERCTFEENFTDGNSAAALLVADLSHVTCVNCTFGSNFTTGVGRVGGAIGMFSEDDPARLDLAFCTIAENTATGEGGGIFVGSNCELRIRNCVVARNSAPTGPDVFLEGGGTLMTLGHSLIGDGTDSAMADGVLGDQVGTNAAPIDAMLGPRAANGGATETYALLPGSPARDAVPDADCEEVDGDEVDEDQRGMPRPAGSACDTGAYED